MVVKTVSKTTVSFEKSRLPLENKIGFLQELVATMVNTVSTKNNNRNTFLFMYSKTNVFREGLFCFKNYRD